MEKEYLTQGPHTVEDGEFRQICNADVGIVLTLGLSVGPSNLEEGWSQDFSSILQEPGQLPFVNYSFLLLAGF